MTNSARDTDFETSARLLPLDALCAALVSGPHQRARQELGRLSAVAAAAHEAGHDAARRVVEAIDALARLLEAHGAKEEHILFPAVRSLVDAERSGQPRPGLPFPTLLHPIRMLESEHARIGLALEVLDAAVNALAAAAWPRWAELRHGADALADDIGVQIRVESLALFPRALELDRRL